MKVLKSTITTWKMNSIQIGLEQNNRKTNKSTVWIKLVHTHIEICLTFLFAFIGIWADDSDNEVADEKPSKSSRSRRRGKGRNVDNVGGGGNKHKLGNSSNFSEPVSFVSGGIQQSGKKKDADKEKNSEDEGRKGWAIT